MNSSVLRPSLVRSVTILALFVGFADLGGCRVEDELSGNGTGGAGNAGAGNAQAGAQNAAGAKSEQRRTDEKELSRLREEILALVDETSACVEDDDCAALPLGKKPCGGASRLRCRIRLLLRRRAGGRLRGDRLRRRRGGLK